MATIRAYGSQSQFHSAFLAYMNDNGSWWYTSLAAGRWLGVRLDGIAALILAAAVALTMMAKEMVMV